MTPMSTHSPKFTAQLLSPHPGDRKALSETGVWTPDKSMPEPEHAIRHLQTRTAIRSGAASGVALRRISTPSPDPIPHSIPIVPSTAQFNDFYR